MRRRKINKNEEPTNFTGNSSYIEAALQLRASGASGVHNDRRTRRLRTRAARNTKALDEFRD